MDERSGLALCIAEKLFIMPTESSAVLGTIQISLFELIVRRLSSTLEDRANFTPSQVFPFFPLPWEPTVDKARQRLDPLVPPKSTEAKLGKVARALLDHRQAMLDDPAKHGLGQAGKGDSFGPTRLYNFYDDPECSVPAIRQLRELHIALTRAVLDAYGWTDFKPTWEFGTPWIDGTTRFFPNAEARAEILARLQVLNHERHALELDLCKKHDLPVPAASTNVEDDEAEEP